MDEIIEFTLFQKQEDLRGGRGNDLPASIFQACRGRWPHLVSRTAFNFCGRADSQDTKEVLEFLERNGRIPNWKRYPKVKYSESNRFQLTGKRTFSNADLDGSILLEAVPKYLIAESASHCDDGSLLLDSSSIVNDIYFGRAYGSSYLICDSSVKGNLESEGLSGLNFLPIQQTKSGFQLFKIWSNCTMPAVASPLIDEAGNPFEGEVSSACLIDDLFNPPILRYTHDSLNHFGNSDIALTKECFGSGRRAAWEKKTLVSQRFRSAADRLGLQIDYSPVRIEREPAIGM